MAKAKVVFVCSECGHESARWMGKCPGCQSWNSLVEERRSSAKGSTKTLQKEARTVSYQEVSSQDGRRLATGLGEIDRVLGGGFVADSLVLLGGNPGIGKSTLLLQAAAKLADHGRVLYVCGEESTTQIKMRGERLGIEGEDLLLLPENRMSLIEERIKAENPKTVIIDSIQTVYSEDLTSAPASVSQVRECTMRMLLEAKNNNRIIILVGHVTKTGSIAGPRVLEHMVDTVLYLEGDNKGELRILRGAKNRFGSTHEVGVFEMTQTGLKGLDNPAALFLSRPTLSSGMVVYPAVEGSRVFFLEIQALCTKTSFGNPRRLATGYDLNRLLLMIAILEKKFNLQLSDQDIYINVAGGMKIQETGADLAVCLAIVSSLTDRMVSPKTLALGEVGLGGEIRSVTYLDRRIKEAGALGFETVFVPQDQKASSQGAGLPRLLGLSQVSDLKKCLQ